MVYTFNAEQITTGTVSVHADSLEDAQRKLLKLQANGEPIFNVEIGSGYLKIERYGIPDTDPEDGTHMWMTASQNARENDEALEEQEELNG